MESQRYLLQYFLFQWGLVNFDASAMWIRDRKLLTDALDYTPFYLRSKLADEGQYPEHLHFMKIFIKIPYHCRNRYRLS